MDNQNAWNKQWDISTRPWFEHPGFVGEVVAGFGSIAELSAPALDVGCGRGVFTTALDQVIEGEVIGCDLAEDSMKALALPVCAADAGKLPFQDASFQSITSILVLEHLPDPRSFVREAYRTLKPGGKLYLLYPNRYSMVSPALFLYRNILGKRDIPIHRPMSRSQGENMMREAGFSQVGAKTLSIADYRKGAERWAGLVARILLPRSMAEEIILVGEKEQ